MNIEKLAKVARKEFLRSPKKTAALGLMCLVAMYFWAPLLWTWVGGGEDSPPAEEVALEETAPAPTALTVAPGQAELPPLQFSWTELREWIENDADMKPAGDDGFTRDPFAKMQHAAVAAIDNDSNSAVEAPTPQQAGLELGGTIVGAGQRLAIIDGRPYRENALVEPEGSTDAPPQTGYRVTRIESDRVVLTRSGVEYVLTLARQGDIDDLVIRRATGRNSD